MTLAAPTLAEVAVAACVSAMTVSRALNRRPGVPSSLRESIVRLAAEMGYEGAPRRRCRRPPRGMRNLGAARRFLMSAPRPAKAGRPPWGTSKVAKPHLLVSSRAARQAVGRGQVIGVLADHLDKPFMSHLVAGVVAAATGTGNGRCCASQPRLRPRRVPPRWTFPHRRSRRTSRTRSANSAPC